MKKIAIYGTGSFGQICYEYFNNKTDVLCFIDEFFEGTINNTKVHKANDLPKDLIANIDQIYVCIENPTHRLEAINRLLQANIPTEKIDHSFDKGKMSRFLSLSYVLDDDFDKVIYYMDNQNELDLQGWFGINNQRGLQDAISKVAKNGMKVLEVGSWKGLSSSIIAKSIQKYNGTLYCVDTWEGALDVQQHIEEVKKKSILNTFLNNMKILGFSDMVKCLKMTSFEAGDLLQNEQFDLVFVDALHNYSFINTDLEKFIPKVKKGGIICGDDCEDYYHNLPSEYVEKYKELDTSPIADGVSRYYHCGVIKALYEKFGKEYTIIPNSTFWYKVID